MLVVIGIGTAWERIVSIGEGEDSVEGVFDEGKAEIEDMLRGDSAAAGERDAVGCRGPTVGCRGLTTGGVPATAGVCDAAAEFWAVSAVTAGGLVGTKT